MTNDSSRLLLIGLDSFPFELLEHWCDDGTLPNLAALRRESSYGHIDSVADLFPGATWPTFSAAQLPSMHGIYHFMQWDHLSMQFRRPAPDWCDYTPFWHRLGEQGVPVIAFDLPFSYPKSAPNVVDVHGWGLHDELAPSFSSPDGILRDLRRRARSALKPDVLGPRSTDMLRRELSGVSDSVVKRCTLIEELAARFPWKLMLAVFAETHRAGHYFWGDRVTGESQGGIKQVAKAFDAVLPRLRALLKPNDRLVLFSLHGMGPYYDFDRFNEPLQAYFEPSVVPSRADFDPIGLLHRKLPGGIRRALSAVLPTPIRDRFFSHYLQKGLDLRQMKALFVPSDGNIYVRANISGRERGGILDSTDVDALMQQIEERLLSMTTAGGQPAVSQVVKPLDAYGDGERSDFLPDRVVRPRLPLEGDILRFPDGSEVTAAWRGWRDGDHLKTGFYMLTGGAPGDAPRLESHEFGRAMCATVGLSF